MTLKTLNLRRSPPPPSAAPIRVRDDFDLPDFDSADKRSTYGLDRTPNGPRRFRNRAAAAAAAAEVVEFVPAPVLEFMPPEPETDAEIDGVETVAPAVEPTAASRLEYPEFEDCNGEVIPTSGEFFDKLGLVDAVPIWLWESPRPVSNIR